MPFPSLGDIQLPVSWQLQLFSGHLQPKKSWISLDLKKPNLLGKNPNNTRNNMKIQIKNKKN